MVCDTPGKTFKGRAGTSGYWAPEVLLSSSAEGLTYDFRCDWWSLGVTLCELLTLTTPFCEPEAASNHERTYANIVRGRFSKSFEHRRSS